MNKDLMDSLRDFMLLTPPDVVCEENGLLHAGQTLLDRIALWQKDNPGPEAELVANSLVLHLTTQAFLDDPSK